MRIPIVTIAFVPIPTQMMMSGPREIFGRLFKITRYGSRTLRSGFIKNNVTATTKPITVLKTNAKIVSFRVIVMCFSKLPVFWSSTSCFNILDGEEIMKGSAMLKYATSSHTAISETSNNILVKWIKNVFIFWDLINFWWAIEPLSLFVFKKICFIANSPTKA